MIEKKKKVTRLSKIREKLINFECVAAEKQAQREGEYYAKEIQAELKKLNKEEKSEK